MSMAHVLACAADNDMRNEGPQCDNDKYFVRCETSKETERVQRANSERRSSEVRVNIDAVPRNWKSSVCIRSLSARFLWACGQR
jgi:hypothetical protein